MNYTLTAYEVANNGRIKSFTLRGLDDSTLVLTKADDRFADVVDAIQVNAEIAKGDKRKASNDDLCDAFRMFRDEIEF